MDTARIKKARQHLARARSLSVLTGAGVSAESGIPTFRDKGGIWDQFDPLKVATPEAFARDPKYVWEWYALRMKKFQDCGPNPAHEALVMLEGRIPSFTLITQNIDDLHRRAGSRHIVELHGNIWYVRCTGCGQRTHQQNIPEELPPRCPDCGELLRPDVVWFGEALDPANIEQASAACAVDLFLIVGTSGEVWPAAGFAHEAKGQGATVIEINTQPSELTDLADLSLMGPAGAILSQLV